MTFANSPHRLWAGCLFALSFLIVLPAGASELDINFNDLSGTAQYNSNGGLSASGIPDTGNFLLKDLGFNVPSVNNADYSPIVTGSLPVRTTLSFTGSINGNSATLTTTNTFTDPSVLADFFGGSTDASRVLNLGSGDLSGAYTASFSDIFFNLTSKDIGGRQLQSAIGNIVATVDGLPDGSAQFSFSDGTGRANLQQVSDVAEPVYTGLLGLALLGIGVIWRRKESLPQA